MVSPCPDSERYRSPQRASVIFIKMMRIYLSERLFDPWRQCAAIHVPSLASLHHEHDRHKSPVLGVARNPKFLTLDHKSMHVCCAKSSVDRDCVLVPGNLFDCARWPPFLSRSGVKDVGNV